MVNMRGAIAGREAALSGDLRAHETYEHDMESYEREHTAWERRVAELETWVRDHPTEVRAYEDWRAAATHAASTGGTVPPRPTVVPPFPGPEPGQPAAPAGVRADMATQRDAAVRLSGVLKPREGDPGAAEDFMTVYGRVGEFGDPRLKARMEEIGRNWDGSGSEKDEAAQAEYAKVKKAMEGWDGKDGTRATVYEGIGMAAPTADQTAAINDQTAAINAQEGLRKAGEEEGGPGFYKKWVVGGRDEVNGWVGFGKGMFDAGKGIYDAFSTGEVPDDINDKNRTASRAAQDKRAERIADAAHDKDGFRMKPLEHTQPTRDLTADIPALRDGTTPGHGPYTVSNETEAGRGEKKQRQARDRQARVDDLRARREERRRKSEPQQYTGHNFA